MKHRRNCLLFLMGPLLLAAACGDDPRSAPLPTGATSTLATTTTQPATPTLPATAIAGACASFPADLRAGATVVRKVTSGRQEREYRLHLPSGADPSKKLPLVLNWHGLGSNAAEQEAYSGLVPLSDRERFILVSPDGTGTPRGFNAFAGGAGADDLQFTRDLLDALQRDLCTDAARVYSTGMSNGAFMSSRLGCDLGDRIAAIAPVAGVNYPAVGKCGRPVPVLAFHGTADAVVPFEPGRIFAIIPYDGAVPNTVAWAKHNAGDTACGAAAGTNRKLSEHVHQDSRPACGGPPVSLVVVEGGGHTWPGAVDIERLGSTTHEISAAELIWAFFAPLTLAR